MTATAPPANPAPIADLSFEQALAELEAIVRALESGQSPLEQSIEQYERGAALKAHCEAKLAAARLRAAAGHSVSSLGPQSCCTHAPTHKRAHMPKHTSTQKTHTNPKAENAEF
jgi:exodeoxyribonuclease VII small subunit